MINISEDTLRKMDKEELMDYICLLDAEGDAYYDIIGRQDDAIKVLNRYIEIAGRLHHSHTDAIDISGEIDSYVKRMEKKYENDGKEND